MATILITGGAGFIGANFVHHWRKAKPEDHIVVLDAMTYAASQASLGDLLGGSRFDFIRGDICNSSLLEALFAKYDFSTVVHFAAESHVDRSIVAPDDFIRTNVTGTHVLLRAAQHAWAGNWAGRRFHHISTDEVFGSLGPNDPPFTEKTPYAPRSPYAASKASSDHLVRAYGHTYGLPVTISNCSNNYGPYQFPEKLIPLMLLNALDGKAMPVYGDGLNVRDWLHVEDHCAAIQLIIEKGRSGETYNVGGENEVANLDLVTRLCSVLEDKFARNDTLRRRFPASPGARNTRYGDLIAFVKDRPGHDRRYAVNTTKIATELGFRPSRSFQGGLAETVDWYLANEAWWRPILSGSHRDWIAAQYGEAAS